MSRSTGPAPLQQYIDYDPEYHYFNFTEEDKGRLPPVVLFDLLINNADRKGSHVLIEKGTGKLWAIDHGLCFHEEEKLRTVLWDSAGQPIPASLRRLPGRGAGPAEGRSAAAPGARARTSLTGRSKPCAGAPASCSRLASSRPRRRTARAFPYPPI